MASYYGQALMNIGSIIGSNMTRSIQEDERQADRLELQRERAAERAELQRERLAAAERENARIAELRRELAAGRSSGGGGRAREYTPDEQTLMALESGEFSSQADVDKFKAAAKSGDFSGYQREVTRFRRQEGPEAGLNNEFSDAVSRKNAALVEEKVKEYPPGFDKEVQSKARVLANIARESVQGKDLKDVNEGRQKEFELGVGQGVLSGNMPMGRGSGAVAAMSGKPIVDVKDGTAFNQYTGTMQTTEKGRSEIGENDAQTAKYRAEARRIISEASGALQKGASQEKLATTLTSLNKLAEGLDPGSPELKRVQDLQMAIVDAMKTSVDGRSSGAPAPGKGGEPKNTGPFQVGATRTIAAGPNKGKTARWDGTGWVLVP